MQWNKKKVSPDKVRELQQRYSMDPLDASILLRRGISSPRDICFFLEEDLRFLHNPFLFKDMETLVDRVYQAVEEEEKCLIFGDRDVDGMCSTVILLEALRDVGLNPQWRVPRGDEAYGLSMEAVEDFAQQEGTLIFTVDNGITCHKEIARAAELGIDVIVLDHHEPQEEGRPPALAVLNPKMEDSSYPFRDLAGCGVCSKAAWALGFSKTSLYNQSLVLLHCQSRDNDLAIGARIFSNLIPGAEIEVLASEGEIAREKLYQFLQGQPILVFRQAEELPHLKALFGAHSQIGLQEIAPELEALSGSFRGKTLTELGQLSKTRLYQDDEQTNLDTLSNLLITLLFRRENDHFQTWIKGLDLAALGTVADMMPLHNENRILVRRGLEQMNRTQRKPLLEILLRQKLQGKPVNAKDLSWSMAPWLNSAGRMKQADLAVDFLLKEDPQDIFPLAEKLHGLNQERRDAGEQALQDHMQEAEQSRESFHQKLVMVTGDDIPRGITGILATRYLKIFNLPVIVLARQGGELSGSIRAPREFPIQDYLQKLSGLFLHFGGHEHAAGFSMKLENYQHLRRQTAQYCKTWEPDPNQEEVLEIDAELPHSYLKESLFDLVDKLGPFGQDFPPISFCARAMSIDRVELLGKEGKHLKLLLKSDETIGWPALFWNSVERYKQDFSEKDKVDVLFHLEENHFRGQRKLQWNILDIRRS